MNPLSFEDFEKRYEPQIQRYIKELIQNDSQALVICCDVFLTLQPRYHECETEEDGKALLYILAKSKSLNYINYKRFEESLPPKFKIIDIGLWGHLGAILLYTAGFADFLFISHNLSAVWYSLGLYAMVIVVVSYRDYLGHKRAFYTHYHQR